MAENLRQTSRSARYLRTAPYYRQNTHSANLSKLDLPLILLDETKSFPASATLRHMVLSLLKGEKQYQATSYS